MKPLLVLLFALALAATLWWSWSRPLSDSTPGTAAPPAAAAPSENTAPAHLAAPPERSEAPTTDARTTNAVSAQQISGRVVDTSGNPVTDDVDVLLLDAQGERLERDNASSDGRFAFTSLPAGAAALEAKKDGWFARERTPLGAGELTLVLERGGRIEGSLILHPVRGSLGVYVGARGERTDERTRFGEIEPDGHFTIDGLDTGTYTVELVGDGEGMPAGALHSIAGVAVQREQTTRDLRLFGLELPALVAEVEVEIVDVFAEPVHDAFVYLFDDAGAMLGRKRARKERVTLPIPLDRPVDALVTHEDYRPARLRLAPPSVRVVLEPGIHVRLRPVIPQPLDRGSVGAFLSLRPELSELAELPVGLFDVRLPLSLGSEESTEVVFPFEGHYRLLVVIRERMGSSFGHTPNDYQAALDEGFDVFARDEGKTRDFWLPPDVFEQAERAR